MQDFSFCYLKKTIVSYFFPMPYLDKILGNSISVLPNDFILTEKERQEVKQALLLLNKPINYFRDDQHVISKYSISQLKKSSISNQKQIFLISEDIYPSFNREDMFIPIYTWEYFKEQGSVLRLGTVKELKSYQGDIQSFLNERLLILELFE